MNLLSGDVPSAALMDIFHQLQDGVYFVDHDRRITFWSRGAERITGYAAREVLGARCSDNILMHVDCDGRSMCLGDCPLHRSIFENRENTAAEVFLHHKEGHRVPVYVRTSPLRDVDGNIIGGIETFSDLSWNQALQQRLEELEGMAYLDSLTGVANRRFAQQTLQSRLDERDRYDWRCGLILADIDHFKHFNDTYGHETGDRVLRMVAKTMSHNVRSFDLVARWGGEEFLILLTSVAHDELLNAATKMLALVRQSRLEHDGAKLNVTISAGATLAQTGDTLGTLVNRADELLYSSKAAGRDRVSIDRFTPCITVPAG